MIVPLLKKERNEYGCYSPERRTKIAKYKIENGTTKPAAHFSKTLGRKVNESTVKTIKKHFLASPSKLTEQRLPYSPRAEVRRENNT